LVDRYQAAVVLKGARTLVGAPDHPVPSVSLAGNPGMAAAGMGDVLTGIMAGLLAQQPAAVNLGEVAAVAVQVHAQAGDSAAYAGAYAMERGLLASDLFPALRAEINPCR
jgi:NAD(P)H-hydrate epimerase